MTSGDFVFGIHAFDSSIRVECGSSEIRDALDRYLFPPKPRGNSAASSPDIHLRICHGPECFLVLLNHKVAATATTLHDAILAAVKALDDAVIHHLKSFYAVHAGAVLIEGRALILPGKTHAGKSSLVAELLRRGASHFSDEYAIIDKQGRTQAYPRPLLLRNGQPLQSLALPEELNAEFATQPAQVGWILAVDYVPGGVWRIREMPQAEAVMLLLCNTPHEMEQSPGMIDFFLRVAANAACYAGTRGDAVEAASRIFDLIGRK